MTRDEQLVAMRPQVITAGGALLVEAFQNEVLRPIIKMQHDVIVQAWHRYVVEQKSRFYKLNRPDQKVYIHAAYKTNRALRAFNLGLICGVLTKVEWRDFRENEKELSKRIISLIAQRIDSSAEAYTSEGYLNT